VSGAVGAVPRRLCLFVTCKKRRFYPSLLPSLLLYFLGIDYLLIQSRFVFRATLLIHIVRRYLRRLSAPSGALLGLVAPYLRLSAPLCAAGRACFAVLAGARAGRGYDISFWVSRA
jgi:hypothetical protein